MFNVNNKSIETTSIPPENVRKSEFLRVVDVVLVFLLLTLNIFDIFF